MLAIAAKLVGSLLAVLALGWFARWLGLGGDVRIRDAAHARQLAFEGIYGFEARYTTIDLAGYSALAKDEKGRHVLIAKKGSGFVTHMLKPPIEGRLDQRFLTIEVPDTDLPPITLNLGEDAQYWAAGLRHLPNG
jgi:hypothetical protein